MRPPETSASRAGGAEFASRWDFASREKRQETAKNNGCVTQVTQNLSFAY
jgi:hypothetical protein